MWTPDYDIVIETLTGSEFEVTVRETDTIGSLKSRIKKYENIPVSQQHILFNQKELTDTMVMKDIPLVKGSRLTLVLGLKGGPVSARRVVSDCENWYDVLNSTRRQEPLTISTTTGVKVLLYKDCKKNIHRLMKLRAGKNSLLSSSGSSHCCSASSSSKGHCHVSDSNKSEDPGAAESQDQQWLLDNISTLEKMQQVRQKLDAKKRAKNGEAALPAVQLTEKERFEQHKVLQHTTTTTQLDQEDDEDQLEGAASMADTNKKYRKWYYRVANSGRAESKCDNGCGRRSSHQKYDRNENYNSNNNNGRSSRINREDFMLPSTTTVKEVVNKMHSRKPSLSGDSNVIYMEKRRNSSVLPKINMNGGGVGGGGGFENKVFIEQHPSGAKSKGYELPKLLIREDSPIETSTTGATLVPDSNCSLETAVAYCSNNSLSSEEDPRKSDVVVQETPNDCEKEVELDKYRNNRRNRHFENRLLTQFYDNSSAQCENFFQAFSTSDMDLQSGRNDSDSLDNNGMKFKWKFGENDPENTDCFLNSLLLQRNRSSKIQKFTKSNLEINKNKPTSSTSSLLTQDGDEGKKEKLSFGKTISVDCITNNIENEKQLQQEKLKKAGKKMDLNDLNNLTFGSSPTLLDSSSQSSLVLLKSEDFFDDDGADEDVVAELLEDDFDEEDDYRKLRLCPNLFSSNNEFSTQSGSYSNNRRHHHELGNYSSYYNNHENMDRTSIIRVKNSGPHCGVANSMKSEFCCPSLNRRDFGSSGGEEDDDNDEDDDEELDWRDDSLDFDDFSSCTNLGYTNLNRSFRRTRSFLPKLVNPSNVASSSTTASDSQILTTTKSMIENDLIDFDEDVVTFDTSDLLSGIGEKAEEELNLDDVEGDLQKIIDKVTTNFLEEEQDEETKADGFSDEACLMNASLLESDLKIMGLDAILNDDDSFEQLIRQHRDLDEIKIEEQEATTTSATVVKKTKQRCAQCNKKLGIIMIMKCHCGKIFCAQHRYAEAHNCSYDFKEEGKKILAKENPLVVADKLPKI